MEMVPASIKERVAKWRRIHSRLLSVDKAQKTRLMKRLGLQSNNRGYPYTPADDLAIMQTLQEQKVHLVLRGRVDAVGAVLPQLVTRTQWTVIPSAGSVFHRSMTLLRLYRTGKLGNDCDVELHETIKTIIAERIAFEKSEEGKRLFTLIKSIAKRRSMDIRKSRRGNQYGSRKQPNWRAVFRNLEKPSGADQKIEEVISVPENNDETAQRAKSSNKQLTENGAIQGSSANSIQKLLELCRNCDSDEEESEQAVQKEGTQSSTEQERSSSSPASISAKLGPKESQLSASPTIARHSLETYPPSRQITSHISFDRSIVSRNSSSDVGTKGVTIFPRSTGTNGITSILKNRSRDNFRFRNGNKLCPSRHVRELPVPSKFIPQQSPQHTNLQQSFDQERKSTAELKELLHVRQTQAQQARYRRIEIEREVERMQLHLLEIGVDLDLLPRQRGSRF